MLKKIRPFIIIGGLWGGLLALLFGTDPAKLPMPLLVAPFIILFMAIFLSVKVGLKQFMPQMSSHRGTIIAILISCMPCILLVLSSINQLTWRDATLLVLIVIALLVYSGRLRLGSEQ